MDEKYQEIKNMFNMLLNNKDKDFKKKVSSGVLSGIAYQERVFDSMVNQWKNNGISDEVFLQCIKDMEAQLKLLYGQIKAVYANDAIDAAFDKIENQTKEPDVKKIKEIKDIEIKNSKNVNKKKHEEIKMQEIEYIKKGKKLNLILMHTHIPDDILNEYVENITNPEAEEYKDFWEFAADKHPDFKINKDMQIGRYYKSDKKAQYLVNEGYIKDLDEIKNEYILCLPENFWQNCNADELKAFWQNCNVPETSLNSAFKDVVKKWFHDRVELVNANKKNEAETAIEQTVNQPKENKFKIKDIKTKNSKDVNEQENEAAFKKLEQEYNALNDKYTALIDENIALKEKSDKDERNIAFLKAKEAKYEEIMALAKEKATLMEEKSAKDEEDIALLKEKAVVMEEKSAKDEENIALLKEKADKYEKIITFSEEESHKYEEIVDFVGKEEAMPFLIRLLNAKDEVLDEVLDEDKEFIAILKEKVAVLEEKVATGEEFKALLETKVDLLTEKAFNEAYRALRKEVYGDESNVNKTENSLNDSLEEVVTQEEVSDDETVIRTEMGDVLTKEKRIKKSDGKIVWMQELEYASDGSVKNVNKRSTLTNFTDYMFSRDRINDSEEICIHWSNDSGDIQDDKFNKQKVEIFKGETKVITEDWEKNPDGTYTKTTYNNEDEKIGFAVLELRDGEYYEIEPNVSNDTKPGNSFKDSLKEVVTQEEVNDGVSNRTIIRTKIGDVLTKEKNTWKDLETGKIDLIQEVEYASDGKRVTKTDTRRETERDSDNIMDTEYMFGREIITYHEKKYIYWNNDSGDIQDDKFNDKRIEKYPRNDLSRGTAENWEKNPDGTYTKTTYKIEGAIRDERVKEIGSVVLELKNGKYINVATNEEEKDL